MKSRKILFFVFVLLLSVHGTALAEKQLDRAEILQLFEQLTNQPRKAWISAGSIEAVHEQYKAPKTTDTTEINNRINQNIAEYQADPAKQELTQTWQKLKLDAIPFNTRYELSNESTMISTETVKYDGEKFYWEINANSRTDSVTPGIDLADNFMTDQFAMQWNDRRVFAWDGEKYSTYASSADNAVIDATDNVPHVVNGPLTAGIIPWGYGPYSNGNLVAIDSSATENIVGGQTQINLTLDLANGKIVGLLLDTAKNYAVLSCSVISSDKIVSRQYSDYRLVSGRWIPGFIELTQLEIGSERLLARDLWEITSIDGNAPGAESFEIGYEHDTLTEYITSLTDKPLRYDHSELIDTEQLLAERLIYASSEGAQPQNCATASMKHALSQLGKPVTDTQLEELIAGPDNKTTLWAMKQFAQSQGLYCRAVTTDIDTLSDLQGCQVILHIPGKEHFVVLESIDDSYVRIIDLTNNKFYYRTDIGFFGMDWSEGVALLISNDAISAAFTEIDDTELANIKGGTGYTCTAMLQDYQVEYCFYNEDLEDCDDFYYIYWLRWGCESAIGGSCGMPVMERYRKSGCVEDPPESEMCTPSGVWTFYYMRACN
ncbi:cysteine peptidase family C39 domain-containing protein [Planctomycetota bacterium]